MTDGDLKTLLIDRAIAPRGVDNFFDLAERLLEHQSVQDALVRRDRLTLAALRIASEEADPDRGIAVSALRARLVELGAGKPGTICVNDLVEKLERAVKSLLAERSEESGAVFPCDVVTRQFVSWPALHSLSSSELAATAVPSLTGPAENDDHPIDQIAAERAFTTVVEISELVFDLKQNPVRELNRGGLALLDAKRLAAASSTDVSKVSSILSIAFRAKLVAIDSGKWLITEFGALWLKSAITTRWKTLATGWFSAITPQVREALAARIRLRWGEELLHYLNWLYPASGTRFHEGLTDTVDGAETLGITVHGVLSSAGNRLIVEGVDAAAVDMHASFPSEGRHAYVQPDLTVVSSGPLEPDVDERLRTIADVESRALSTSYRLSSVSLNRALASGETAASILEFLTTVSLSGLPQPVEYLVLETAQRHGTVRVGETTDSSSTASYVRSEDAHLLRTALVDQALSMLSLSPEGSHQLVSPLNHDTVFQALSNARYPVAAETPEGDIVSTPAHHIVARPTMPPADALDTVVERLRASWLSSDFDPERAWIVRQLRQAISDRSAATITFTSPDGSIGESVLEPSSIAGGRMRARDRDADIERTLPLSCISAVKPATTSLSGDS